MAKASAPLPILAAARRRRPSALILLADLPQQPADVGGYPSQEELLKAYRASSNEGKRLAAENAKLTAEKEAIWNAVNQRPDIQHRSRPEDRLAEYGIPADAIDEFVNERVARALAPLSQGFEARNRVLNEYPDYNKFEADVAQFIQSDPDMSQRYAKMFSVDPVGAMELAFLKFGEAKRRTAPAPTPQTGGSSEAALPTQRSGDARRVDETNSQSIEDAWEAYKKSGSKADAERYAHARLKDVIKEDFLRQ